MQENGAVFLHLQRNNEAFMGRASNNKKIQDQLEQLSITVEALQLWVEKTIGEQWKLHRSCRLLLNT